MSLEQEVQRITERNRRVEADKAWETSVFRKALIAAITYVVAVFSLFAIGVRDFYVSALIPTLGFLLSTITLPPLKRWWLRKKFPGDRAALTGE